MNKLIVGIVVIAVVVVGGLLYFNLGDSGTGEMNTGEVNNESVLPTPPAEPSENQLPVAEPSAPTQNSPAQTVTPPPQKPTPPPPTQTSTPPPPPSAGSGQATPQPTTHQVSIQGFAFSQPSITVKKGDTVVWTNKDSAPHTVTGDSNQLSSQTLNNGGTYSFTFASTGTFNYHCAFHPGMTGKVVVTQ